MQLKEKNECALICYVLAGYPDRKMCNKVVDALVSGGADIIEIGIPFSDPIADGPTLQKASSLAIRKGITAADALHLARNIRDNFSDLPIIAMTYSNIVIKMGLHKFMKDAKASGFDGFILPDMPIEESQQYYKNASANGLSTVFLVSPNTSGPRIKQISSVTTGFLYLVSILGVTGARISFENYSIDALNKVKRIIGSKIPVGIGFGISKPEHVKIMSNSGADAVVVASSIINMITESTNRGSLVNEIREYTKSLKAACGK
ncbi:MAG TPA: tryptophan synthase subunit alpha [Nitrososphaeraceae archaeon]